MPNAARITPGRTGPQHGLAFENQDIVDAVASEMISGACAHAPAADYDHVCRRLHDEATIYITVECLRKGSAFVQAFLLMCASLVDLRFQIISNLRFQISDTQISNTQILKSQILRSQILRFQILRSQILRSQISDFKCEIQFSNLKDRSQIQTQNSRFRFQISDPNFKF